MYLSLYIQNNNVNNISFNTHGAVGSVIGLKAITHVYTVHCHK